MQEHVRAAVFDLGNTLWFSGYEPAPEDMDRVAAELLQPWLARTGMTPPVPIASIIRGVWEAYDQAWRIEMDRATYRDPSLAFLARGAFAQHGIDLDPALAEAFWQESWIGARRFGIELYPDTLDVLRALRARGVLIGINSNRPCNTAIMMRDLADLGIAPYTDAAVCSGDTGYLKPHPSTFEYIIDALNVAPREAVMIGDSCEADMRGARAVGMRTVLKLNGRHGVDTCGAVDYAIHDLGELLALPFFGHPVAATESLTPHDDDNEDRY
jgi:HAD superfamily hydrolase (TIGR01549 family)